MLHKQIKLISEMKNIASSSQSSSNSVAQSRPRAHPLRGGWRKVSHEVGCKMYKIAVDELSVARVRSSVSGI